MIPKLIFIFNFVSMERVGGEPFCPAARGKVRWSNDAAVFYLLGYLKTLKAL